MKDELDTGAEKTWCPGCRNFMLFSAVKKALEARMDQVDRGREDVSIAAGIGCHGKMFDYLDVGGVYSLHGRVIPTLTGLRIGNPNMEVIGFAGDGDTYSEGANHFVQAGRFNPDSTLVVHNNEIFGLTTGQATPTTEKGKRTKAQPHGHYEKPMNPIETAITSDISFVARVYARDIQQTKKVLEEAMEWNGFAVVDVLMPCIAYNNGLEEISGDFYTLEDHDPGDKSEALEKAMEWGREEGGYPLGVFYRNRKPTVTEKRPKLSEMERDGKAWFQVDKE